MKVAWQQVGDDDGRHYDDVVTWKLGGQVVAMAIAEVVCEILGPRNVVVKQLLGYLPVGGVVETIYGNRKTGKIFKT